MNPLWRALPMIPPMASAGFLVALFALGASDGFRGQPQPEAWLSGTVVKGPMCPGPARPDRPCPDKPVRGTFQILDGAGEVVATFTTDEEGRFRIRLSPGEYTVLPEGERASANPLRASARVKVLGGGETEVRLYWDTGMR